MKSRSKYSRRS